MSAAAKTIAPRASRREPVAHIAAYIRLTKPRIILLLLITTVPAMVLAERGMPSAWLILTTLLGGAACAGGANAINQYLERDLDGLMARTRRRPLPARVLEPRQALAFGLALGAGGFVFLALTVNLLAASLSLGALGFYVVVYTMWLKPHSPQNIVIGGAAGAAPALVGWAAVTGTVGLPAATLFLIVFLWTPPHFWALAVAYERDYAAAGIPMLPVVSGRVVTARQILLYALMTVAASLALVPVGKMGPLYLVVASALGVALVWKAMRVLVRTTGKVAMGLFRYSIVYLALLFAAVGADTLIRSGA